MSLFVSRGRAVALALALAWVHTTTAHAQSQGDKDLKAISAYTLTMPKYKQLVTAMTNLGKAAQRDPTVGKALENSGNLSLDEMAARLAAVPAAKRAVADAGLTPREYAVAQGAMLQAGMSYALMKEYKLTADSVSRATGVSKANLEFMRANETEIQRMGKELEGPTEEVSEGQHADSAQ